MKTAIFGYGTVGSGVAAILEQNRDIIARSAGEEISLKYVLDIREFPGDPIQEKIVHDIGTILADPEVETVVETMGGVEPAFTFVRKALEAGKNAATSNKELVAKHGAQLLKTAAEHNVNFFFEASVGGGIPILRPMHDCLTADRILEICGILNGTTNYMLTRMKRDGASYDDVLHQAQANGYAERNPSADVGGFDACRKIAILTSLACGRQVDYEDIFTEGITELSVTDFAYAKAMNGDIKLLGSSSISGGEVFAKVAPEIISEDDPLYSVNDVFNAIKIRGDMLGNVMFYGKGAGSLPTASAVISDVVQTVRNRGRNLPVAWDTQKQEIADSRRFVSSFLVRVKGDPADSLTAVTELLGPVKTVQPENVEGEYGVVTEQMSAGELEDRCSRLKGFISRLYIRD